MQVSIKQVPVAEILPFRHQYLIEVQAQIRYDACHSRGWSDSFLFEVGGQSIGYGAVKGRDDLNRRDAIFEVYVVPFWRHKMHEIYAAFLKESAVKYLECQTNDPIHAPMVLEYGTKIKAPTILFADQHRTLIQIDGAEVRKRAPEDVVFEKNRDPGAYVLVMNNEVVASGGFLLHYNVPFADLYMETKSDHRNKGYASFLLQELKKICYQSGRVPAARCSVKNPASRSALLKAGMHVCGHMLTAEVKGS